MSNKNKLLSKSPDSGSFIRNMYLKKLTDGGMSLEEVNSILLMNDNLDKLREDTQSDPTWQNNNLEYNLLSTEWLLEKVRASDVYAQNLYAALCNVTWQLTEIWPILKGESWSCSWRRAGGIIADMQEKGDYIDWYCSGIQDITISNDAIEAFTDEEKTRYINSKSFVSEGVVTDEIKTDLKLLGWHPLSEDSDNDDI